MKRIIALVASMMGLAILIAVNTETSMSDASTIQAVNQEDAIKMVQEVAMAYYRRGTNIDYDSWRRNGNIAPEEITDQNIAYTVCSGFGELVYREALGMTIPNLTRSTTAYAKLHSEGYNDAVLDDYVGESGFEDIVYFTNMLDEHETENSEGYAQFILGKIEEGDILNTRDAVRDTGHVMLVYKIIEENGVRKNAILLHSTTGTYTRANNDLMLGLTYNSRTPVVQGDEFNITKEGTVRADYLITSHNILRSSFHDRKYLTILRPVALLGEGKYNKGLCRKDNCQWAKTVDYAGFPASSIARLNYPGIQIDKTVDVFNGSLVEPTQEIEYLIKIKNNSGESYHDVVIEENVNTDLVEIVSAAGGTINGKKLSWNGITIGSGETKEIKYKVAVKDNYELIGQEIISTGNVVGIPSATIKNKIYLNLPEQKRSLVKSLYDEYKVSYKGINLINKIYEQIDPAFVAELEDGQKFTDLEEMLGKNFDNSERIYSSNPPTVGENENYLIRPADYAFMYSYSHRPVINEKNAFADKVLNNDYGAVFSNCVGNSACNSGFENRYPRQIGWEYGYYVSSDGEEVNYPYDERALRVFPETLQTGDILLYLNVNDSRKILFGTASANNGGGNMESVSDDTDFSDEDKNLDDADEAVSNVTTDNYWVNRGLEQGFYAFVYLEDGDKGPGFYGGSYDLREYEIMNEGAYVTYDHNGRMRHIDDYFISAKNDSSIDNLSVLLAKDYYAVLRPSMKQYNVVEFAETEIEKTIGDDDFTVELTGDFDADEVEFTSSNTNVATVGAKTGKVTLRGAGTTIIKVIIPGDFDTYDTVATYTLNIAEQSEPEPELEPEPEPEPQPEPEPGSSEDSEKEDEKKDDKKPDDKKEDEKKEEKSEEKDDSKSAPNTGAMMKDDRGGQSSGNLIAMTTVGIIICLVGALWRKIWARRKVLF